MLRTSANIRGGGCTSASDIRWDARAGFDQIKIDYGDGRSYTSYSENDAEVNAFWHKYWNPGTFSCSGDNLRWPREIGYRNLLMDLDFLLVRRRFDLLRPGRRLSHRCCLRGRLDFVGNRIWSMLLARWCRLLARLEQRPKRSSEHHERTCIWIDPTQVPPNLATSAQPMK